MVVHDAGLNSFVLTALTDHSRWVAQCLCRNHGLCHVHSTGLRVPDELGPDNCSYLHVLGITFVLRRPYKEEEEL